MGSINDLLQRLPECDAAEVSKIWSALLVARHDCEAMAARGVRIARDVSRDWQETVSDLIDRVVAQDNEIGQLKQQVGGACVHYCRPVPCPACLPCMPVDFKCF